MQNRYDIDHNVEYHIGKLRTNPAIINKVVDVN